MAEPTTRAKLTYEDFLQLPDDGKRPRSSTGSTM